MIELSPFSSDTSNTVDMLTSAAQTEQQTSYAQAMARFAKQERPVIRKIAMPYFIIWSVIALPVSCVLFITTGFLGFLAFCGALIGYVGVFALAARNWETRISQLMDFPTVLATTDELALNEPLTVQYSQHFKQDTTIEVLRVQLVLREWVRYTQGTNTYTDTRDIVQDEDWRDMVAVTAGETVEREFKLRVPEHAMHTWRTADDNRIHWMLRLDVDLPGWLDYKETYNIVVKPEVYTGDV